MRGGVRVFSVGFGPGLESIDSNNSNIYMKQS